MSAVDFDMPDTIETGGDANRLKKEGSFHFAIDNLDTEPVSEEGKALDGWRVSMQVLDGTVRENGVCTEKKKTIDILLFNPKLNGKDGGKWARLKQARLLVAAGLVEPNATGKGVSFDPEKAGGCQICAKLQLKQEQDGSQGKFLEFAYADIFHVDDPDAKDIPKDAAALKLLPKTLRRTAESFAKAKDTNGHAAKPDAPAKHRETVPATSSVSNDLGDL